MVGGKKRIGGGEEEEECKEEGWRGGQEKNGQGSRIKKERERGGMEEGDKGALEEIKTTATRVAGGTSYKQLPPCHGGHHHRCSLGELSLSLHSEYVLELVFALRVYQLDGQTGWNLDRT